MPNPFTIPGEMEGPKVVWLKCPVEMGWPDGEAPEELQAEKNQAGGVFVRTVYRTCSAAPWA